MTTTLFKSLGAATTLVGILATASSANAASLTSSASSGLLSTDFANVTLSVQKFDSSLGTLKGVTLKFDGQLQGVGRYENTGPNASSVTVNLTGQLGLDLGGQSLFSLNPQKADTYNFAAFDGTLDFGGTSGSTINGPTAQMSQTRSFTDASFLQAFIGSGNLDFLLSAQATSTVSGSGNIFASVTTLARGGVEVTYDYDPVQSVPEPSAALGFGLVAGIGLLSQRKKSWIKSSN
ncbi:choice-of-anchor E domain-containing protein [Anabaena sp. CA = ATCC 33047]|uniref:choice-of-anchor E domain-containing protein n=1 Tax=Anabaena sp. (strain CA / ATCC 33047) TaxID=52271 RepID=UPI000835782A|nr:PEP-CTERM sorting domain-containing protein [Anabaena sp. CA = ATCC 33047]